MTAGHLPKSSAVGFRNIGVPRFYFKELDSTNNLLKTKAAEGAAHGTVVVAGRQTGGRGRPGRSWASPSGGLYYSVLLRSLPDGTPPGVISLSAGMAVLRACGRFSTASSATARSVSPAAAFQSSIALKWPNDVYIGEKKLAGVLSEGVKLGDGCSVVVGIGVNVNTRRDLLPEVVRSSCAVLSEAAGRKVGVHELEDALLVELKSTWTAIAKAGWRLTPVMKELNGVSLLSGRTVEIHAGSTIISGRAGKILPSGELELITAAGKKTIAAGEVFRWR